MKHFAVHSLALRKLAVTEMHLLLNEGLSPSQPEMHQQDAFVSIPILSCPGPLLISSPSCAMGAKSIAGSIVPPV